MRLRVPRTTSRSPPTPIRRATVHFATVSPSCRNWCHIFRTPQPPKWTARVDWIFSRNTTSRGRGAYKRGEPRSPALWRSNLTERSPAPGRSARLRIRDDARRRTHNQRIWRSSSAAAENALALWRISLARRSSRFSRSSTVSRSSSAGVGRASPAFRTPRRSVSVGHPDL
jgi:hypothetical protein